MDNIFIQSLIGSRAYNLHSSVSDYDYRYVRVSPLLDVLSPFKILDTKSRIEGEEDNTIWELKAFLKYAANGNPSIYEVLYSNSIVCVTHDPNIESLLQELLSNKHKFLNSRSILDAHRGYATAQLKKIDWDAPTARTKKAIVAYLRVLDQGANLLEKGTTDILIPDGHFRDQLLKIKFDSYLHRTTLEKLFERAETRISKSFENTKLTSPDYPWIEDFNKRCYLAFNSLKE